jgi:hypothetical protein
MSDNTQDHRRGLEWETDEEQLEDMIYTFG